MLGRKTAEEKVASFLLDMASHFGGSPRGARLAGEINFDPPLTRTQIADVLGLTIETVSRQLTKLKREGLDDLSSGRAVTIRDRGSLQERAEAA